MTSEIVGRLPVDANSDANRKKLSAKDAKNRSAWPMGIVSAANSSRGTEPVGDGAGLRDEDDDERDPDPDLEQCGRADADDLAGHQVLGADGTHCHFRDAARGIGKSDPCIVAEPR
jgi:hypothetical protein